MTGATGGIGAKVAKKLIKAGNFSFFINFKNTLTLIFLNRC
jgi:NADP-dependent 3-hydroxy acid dehydrogenase YdfG